MNYFFWSMYLLESEILDSSAVALKKMGQFRKFFVGIFEILVDPFLSGHFQNVSTVESLVW